MTLKIFFHLVFFSKFVQIDEVPLFYATCHKSVESMIIGTSTDLFVFVCVAAYQVGERSERRTSHKFD